MISLNETDLPLYPQFLENLVHALIQCTLYGTRFIIVGVKHHTHMLNKIAETPVYSEIL